MLVRKEFGCEFLLHSLGALDILVFAWLITHVLHYGPVHRAASGPANGSNLFPIVLF